jgi:uncharacterized membrane protein YedE/YeeE
MSLHPYLQSLIGGLLIGLSSWLLLASLGRVAGISGITAGALTRTEPDTRWRWAFLAGLCGAGLITTLWLAPPAPPSRSAAWLISAGLLVGVGTIVGAGCTSGHGVCGLGRRSMRSLVATLTFMATAALTVFLLRHLI